MIKVAIAGCGSITRYRHAPEYRANASCKITGFYDYVPDRAKELVVQYGGKLYLSFDDLLADKTVNAVSICTANKYHAPMAIQALQAGKHVLCEKPMAQSRVEAEEMVATAKKYGKYLMVDHNQRLAPAHVKAFELLRKGEIGKILTFKTNFGHGGPESWGIDKSNNTWFFDKNMAYVGCLGDLGVHKIDLMRFLLTDEFSEVAAITGTLDKKNGAGEPISVEDNAVVLLRTKSGIIGTLTNSWTYFGEEDNSTIIYGTEGILKIYYNVDYPLEVIQKNGASAYYKLGKIATNAEQVKSGIIDLFIESLTKNQEPPITGVDGLESIKIVDAILDSVKFKKTINIL